MSRGLGDVYKRQPHRNVEASRKIGADLLLFWLTPGEGRATPRTCSCNGACLLPAVCWNRFPHMPANPHSSPLPCFLVLPFLFSFFRKFHFFFVFFFLVREFMYLSPFPIFKLGCLFVVEF